MINTPRNSILVELAYDVFEKHMALQTTEARHEISAHLARVMEVIENHSGLDGSSKDDLKAAAVLIKSGITVENPMMENALDMTFGTRIGEIIRMYSAPSIKDDTKIGPGCALVMAFSCASMEGTLQKIANPETHAAGIIESGGAANFRGYILDLTEERMMLRSYSQTPVLLKYEMTLIDKMAAALGMKPNKQIPAYDAFTSAPA